MALITNMLFATEGRPNEREARRQAAVLRGQGTAGASRHAVPRAAAAMRYALVAVAPWLVQR